MKNILETQNIHLKESFMEKNNLQLIEKMKSGLIKIYSAARVDLGVKICFTGTRPISRRINGIQVSESIKIHATTIKFMCNEMKLYDA